MNLNNFDLFNPTPEHQLLRDTVKQWVLEEVEPQALKHDKKEHFNLSLFRKLADLGLLGVTVPEAYGGSGLDAIAAVIAHEEIAYSDPGFCLAYLAHSMLAVNNLAQNGSEEQKKKYLPKLCSGEWVGAMAMSEPNYGTDVLGMESTAVKKGHEYIINGQKMWITNGCLDEKGTLCDLVWLYARTNSQSPSSKPQISTFIVEKGTKGFSLGQKIYDKLGMRASNTAELVFTDCHVGEEQLVGKAGDSLHHMMRNLEIERVTLAAISSGIALRCVDIMKKYASQRVAFKNPIYKFGQIQKYIAESYAELQAMRCYLYNTARKIHLNKAGQRIDTDGVKLFAAPMAKKIADRAIQVLGGYGYVGEYIVERLWRDAKLIEIGGGTLEAHEKNITFDLMKT